MHRSWFEGCPPPYVLSLTFLFSDFQAARTQVGSSVLRLDACLEESSVLRRRVIAVSSVKTSPFPNSLHWSVSWFTLRIIWLRMWAVSYFAQQSAMKSHFRAMSRSSQSHSSRASLGRWTRLPNLWRTCYTKEKEKNWFNTRRRPICK